MNTTTNSSHFSFPTPSTAQLEEHTHTHHPVAPPAAEDISPGSSIRSQKSRQQSVSVVEPNNQPHVAEIMANSDNNNSGSFPFKKKTPTSANNNLPSSIGISPAATTTTTATGSSTSVTSVGTGQSVSAGSLRAQSLVPPIHQFSTPTHHTQSPTPKSSIHSNYPTAVGNGFSWVKIFQDFSANFAEMLNNANRERVSDGTSCPTTFKSYLEYNHEFDAVSKSIDHFLDAMEHDRLLAVAKQMNCLIKAVLIECRRHQHHDPVMATSASVQRHGDQHVAASGATSVMFSGRSSRANSPTGIAIYDDVSNLHRGGSVRSIANGQSRRFSLHHDIANMATRASPRGKIDVSNLFPVKTDFFDATSKPAIASLLPTCYDNVNNNNVPSDDLLSDLDGNEFSGFNLMPQMTANVIKATDELGMRVVNQYTFLKELGRGQFGRVKLAMDDNDQLVAVKILPHEDVKRHRQEVMGKVRFGKMELPPSASKNVGTESSNSTDDREQSFSSMHHRRRKKAAMLNLTTDDSTSGDDLKSHILQPISRRTEANATTSSSDHTGHLQHSGGGHQEDDGETVVTTALQKEIEIMSKLKHKNIVRLREVIDDPTSKNVYLVMTYAERGPLIRLKPDGTCKPLNFDIAKGYMMQLFNGLQYLHAHKIAHRDIKPDNILLRDDGVVVFSDFGVSSFFDPDAAESLQDDSTLRKFKNCEGTPNFHAPEICAGNEFLGPPADVWALGVTLYIMFYGRLPFTGSTIIEMRRSIMCDELSFPDLEELEEADKSLDESFVSMSLGGGGGGMLNTSSCGGTPRVDVSTNSQMQGGNYASKLVQQVGEGGGGGRSDFDNSASVTVLDWCVEGQPSKQPLGGNSASQSVISTEGLFHKRPQMAISKRNRVRAKKFAQHFELQDLLRHMLEKDPLKRFTVRQCRYHNFSRDGFESSSLFSRSTGCDFASSHNKSQEASSNSNAPPGGAQGATLSPLCGDKHLRGRSGEQSTSKTSDGNGEIASPLEVKKPNPVARSSSGASFRRMMGAHSGVTPTVTRPKEEEERIDVGGGCPSSEPLPHEILVERRFSVSSWSPGDGAGDGHSPRSDLDDDAVGAFEVM